MASLNDKNLKLGDDRKFQIVLIGYDRTEELNGKYLGGMSWPGVKIDEKGSIKDLAEKGDTGFIPNVVLLKPDGTMVSNELDEVLKKLGELASS